jgi:cardiolipin synthase A/B
MHAKVMTVDGRAAVVGSSNFNRRSLDHDEEVMLVALDRGVTAELDRDFAADLDRSRQIDLDRWRNRGLVQKALERATAPVRRFF